MLDGVSLREAFFRDGQRLGHDCQLPQILRHMGEVFFIIHIEFSHEPVHFFDAALSELAVDAVVLFVFAARIAIWVAAGAADGRHHKVADI